MLNNKVNVSNVNGMFTTNEKNTFKKVKSLTTSIAKKGIEKFNLTIEQSKLIASLDERITDVHKLHKSNLKDVGTPKDEIPTKFDIINELLGIGKAWYYKLLNAGKLDAKIIEKFNDYCDKNASIERSIERLNAWAKDYETHKGEIEPTPKAIREAKEDSSEEKTDSFNLVSVSIHADYLNAKKGLSFKIDGDKVVRTSNNLKQLVEALDVIKAQIVEQMNATKTQSKRQSRQKDEALAKAMEEISEETEVLI